MSHKKIKYKLKRSRICSSMLEAGMKNLRLLGIFNKKKINSLPQGKKVFLLLSPTHGNLGDHAIAYATKEFIKNNMPEYNLVELSILDTLINIDNIKQLITKDDIILINGGGNIGDNYKIEEYGRRIIIDKIHNCKKIISMPQSMSFSNSSQGLMELNKTKSVYNNNSKLVLCARENITYELMKDAFTNKIIFTPDIVLSLDKENKLSREDILLCLRHDEESILTQEMRNELIDLMNSNFSKIIVTDTVVDKVVSLRERNILLEREWEKFNRSKLVITDRLHGTIFAAITGTPALIIRTYNHKIIESVKWLKGFNYIKMLESNEPQYIFEQAKLILERNKCTINRQKFTTEYEPLLQELIQ